MSAKDYEELIKEIQEKLKNVSQLERKLEGEDKETLRWLIYGYNECAKTLNQKEEVINKAIDYIEENKQHEYRNGNLNEYYLELNEKEMNDLLNILKEVE